MNKENFVSVNITPDPYNGYYIAVCHYSNGRNVEFLHIDMVTLQQTKTEDCTDDMMNDSKTKEAIKNLEDKLIDSSVNNWVEKISLALKSEAIEFKAYKKNPEMDMFPKVEEKTWYIDRQDIDGFDCIVVNSDDDQTPGLFEQEEDKVDFNELAKVIADSYTEWSEGKQMSIRYF